MAKRDLQAQLNAVQYRENGTDDFDGLVDASPTRPSSKIKVVMLPVASLVEYKDENFEKLTGRPQPFRAYTQEDLEALAKSISEHGVIDPITVRPFEAGKYQIIAGRNRTRASVLCGIAEVPGIVRTDIDDAQAALIMLDTNLRQRHNLLYSEKAYAYKMQMDIMSCRGRRTDLDATLCNGCTKLDSLSKAGEKQDDSRRTVAYLIRLTYLIPSLLSMVDEKQMPFKVGVALSYLPTETQEFLLRDILPQYGKIKSGQAEELKRLSENGQCSEAEIKAVFESKPKQTLSGSFSIKRKHLADYPELLEDESKLEKLFMEFLQKYRSG